MTSCLLGESASCMDRKYKYMQVKKMMEGNRMWMDFECQKGTCNSFVRGRVQVNCRNLEG